MGRWLIRQDGASAVAKACLELRCHHKHPGLSAKAPYASTVSPCCLALLNLLASCPFYTPLGVLCKPEAERIVCYEMTRAA